MVNNEYKDEIFICYSFRMDRFLKENGLTPILNRESYHKDGSGKEWQFSMYKKDKKFESLALEWKHRKEINFKYFSDERNGV